MTDQPKPKKFTRVEVPADLRQFLREVAEMIDRGDVETTVESYDLLQCDFAYGGLADEETATYEFTYLPRKGVKTRWEFGLSVKEIHEAAAGVRELELWACEDENCGSMFSWADVKCPNCDCKREVRTLPKGEFSTRSAWALAYFDLYPDADPFRMVGDYNGTELGESLGYFSLNEATELQRISQSMKRN